MTSEVKEITVGAMVVAVLLGVMIYLYGASEDVSATGNGTRVTASFNRVDGLIAGDPVYLSGIRVGVVDKMWLNENFRVIVAFRLNEGLELPNDSSAAIHTDGLFGSKFVVLEPGAEDILLKNGDQLTFTQDAVIVSDLLDLIISEGKANRTGQ